MELMLIRHARPEKVISRDGTPADPPLSELGHAQAAELASWLASEGIDRIYASPMRRAHQTALPLAESQGLSIELEHRIAEYDRDSEFYIPLEELRETDYGAWREFMKNGYPPGMDLEAFCRDVIDGMVEIIEANPGGRVAVVCHGGVINTWASHVIGMDFKMFFAAEYTSVNRFFAAGSGERSVGSLNETAHLRELS